MYDITMSAESNIEKQIIKVMLAQSIQTFNLIIYTVNSALIKSYIGK